MPKVAKNAAQMKAPCHDFRYVFYEFVANSFLQILEVIRLRKSNVIQRIDWGNWPPVLAPSTIHHCRGKDRAIPNSATNDAMKFPILSKAAFAVAGISVGACVHTPPGTSVEVALAKKPELVRLPTPPQPVATVATGGTVVRDSARSGASMMVPAVEPELPNNKVERVAEAYTRGQFCMQAGKDEEAITAFEEAVKIDPAFSDGWNNLAMLYEKTGNEKKALEAFRRSKKVAGS